MTALWIIARTWLYGNAITIGLILTVIGIFYVKIQYNMVKLMIKYLDSLRKTLENGKIYPTDVEKLRASFNVLKEWKPRLLEKLTLRLVRNIGKHSDEEYILFSSTLLKNILNEKS